MELKPGSRWKSIVCGAEVVVVRPPGERGELECGGHTMVPSESDPPNGSRLDPAHADGVEMGKRYTSAAAEIEVLCVKSGEGSLAYAGVPLELKDAKPLPSSD